MKLTGRARHDDVDLERDRSLVERCQSGDERAFEDLYLRYRDRLFRFCLRRTGNASEAEDLVQEAFAKAWKALPNFSGERRFYPWLSVIANNLCTDLARKGRRCTPVEESSLDLLAPTVDSEQEALVDRQGDGELLEAALGRISARHREVLELREGRNWSYQQIASHAGVEVSTIETLLFRARRSLRREYMTLTKAETGLAGLLALPLVGMRKLLGGARRLLHPATLAAKAKRVLHPLSLPGKVAATASQVSVGSVIGGVAVAATAAAVTVGAVAGTHSGGHTQHPQTPVSATSSTKGSASGAGGATGRDAHRQLAATSQATKSGGASPAARAPGSPSSSTSAGSAGSGPLGGATSATSGGTSLGKTVNKTLSGTNKTVSSLAGTASGTVSGVTSGVSGTVSGVTSGVSGTVSGVTSGVSGTVSGVTSGVSGTVSGVTSGSGTVPGTTVPLP